MNPVDRGSPQRIDYSDEVAITTNPLLQGIYFAGGTISIVLGVIGIVIPLLPTTPFLLLSAYLFSKSSVRYYNWLMNHRRFGPFIRNYREGKGIPREVKITAILFLWVTILTSMYFTGNIFWMRGLLVFIVISVTWHIISLPTLTEDPLPETDPSSPSAGDPSPPTMPPSNGK